MSRHIRRDEFDWNINFSTLWDWRESHKNIARESSLFFLLNLRHLKIDSNLQSSRKWMKICFAFLMGWFKLMTNSLDGFRVIATMENPSLLGRLDFFLTTSNCYFFITINKHFVILTTVGFFQGLATEFSFKLTKTWFLGLVTAK